MSTVFFEQKARKTRIKQVKKQKYAQFTINTTQTMLKKIHSDFNKKRSIQKKCDVKYKWMFIQD